MSANLTPDIRPLPLAALTFSQTRAQVERREHFDKASLTELAESIKSVGLVQPILVRPLELVKENWEHQDDPPLFEVVAGERRVLAAREAGLNEILGTVRDLTDEQVLELQLVENLQRQDLHELAEAEGYEALQKLGHSIEDMAIKTGKSKATVRARMKLLALCEHGRKAFYASKISASIALLIARLPLEKWQMEATEYILQPWSGADKALSYRDASDYLQKEYMLRLSEAPFPRDDATLVPAAGTCGACPKRTGNQPDIFGDVRSGDVCTDRLCFNQKRAAWNKLQVAKAKETGQEIIRGAEARKAQSRWSNQLNGYVRPSDKCEADPKKRTYAQLLGKADIAPVLLQNPDSGKFSKVYKTADVASHLATQGIKVRDNTREESKPDTRWQAEQAKREEELKYRRALWAAIYRAAPEHLSRHDYEAVAKGLWETGYGPDEELYTALGWDPKKATLESRLKKLSDVQLAQLIFALLLWPEASDEYGSAPSLHDAAKRLKVDPQKVRADMVRVDLAQEEANMKASAKASKKKTSTAGSAKASKKKAARK